MLSILVITAILSACGSQSRGAKVASCLKRAGVTLGDDGSDHVPPNMTADQLVRVLARCGVRNTHSSGAHEAGIVSAAVSTVVERELAGVVKCLQEHDFPVSLSKNPSKQLFNANGVDTRDSRFRVAYRSCRRKFVEAIGGLKADFGPEQSG
jgi:hypothetical protein